MICGHFRFFEETDQAKRLVIYACTSGYPVPFKDVCLLEIVRLKKIFGSLGSEKIHLVDLVSG